MKKPTPRAAPVTAANIETVVNLEQEFLQQRTPFERAGDRIAAFSGSMQFIVLHVAGFAAWIAINTGKLGMQPFDPYPYVLLSMVVSLEAVLLSSFVLMKQNRMSQRSEHRDHLNLQVDLLAEKEITMMLQMQRRLCDHFGLAETGRDQEAEELSQDTAIEALSRDLKEKLTGE